MHPWNSKLILSIGLRLTPQSLVMAIVCGPQYKSKPYSNLYPILDRWDGIKNIPGSESEIRCLADSIPETLPGALQYRQVEGLQQTPAVLYSKIIPFADLQNYERITSYLYCENVSEDQITELLKLIPRKPEHAFLRLPEYIKITSFQFDFLIY